MSSIAAEILHVGTCTIAIAAILVLRSVALDCIGVMMCHWAHDTAKRHN